MCIRDRAMVKASADYINYPVDEDTLSKMIDSLCDMSKIVNGTTEQEVETCLLYTSLWQW